MDPSRCPEQVLLAAGQACHQLSASPHCSVSPLYDHKVGGRVCYLKPGSHTNLGCEPPPHPRLPLQSLWMDGELGWEVFYS